MTELPLLFTPPLVSQREEEVAFMTRDKNMVEDMFLNCLGRLSCKWQGYHTLNSEEREEKGQDKGACIKEYLLS